MTEREIIEKWTKGLSINKLALIYKRRYNQQVKIVRSDLRHRHDGRYITSYDALAYVERVIYKYLKNK